MFFLVVVVFQEAAGLESVCLCFPERHSVELPPPLLVYTRPFPKLLPRRDERLEINTVRSSEGFIYLI